MMYRFASLSILATFAAISLAAGCSSDDSSGSAPGDYEPAGNGSPMAEAAACNAIVAAEDARRSALNCGPVTRPPCPTYISLGHDACSQYDQGTVEACVQFISGLSCDGLKTRKCIVKALPGSAPNGCPAVDSGPDAEPDAAPDAAEDAPADAEADVAVDAGDDASADAADDAADAAGD